MLRRRRRPARLAVARATAMLAALAGAACSSRPHGPPPAAPASSSAAAPRTHPRTATPSDLALALGRWQGRDPEDWRYDLEVQLDGTFTQTVHQGTTGTECVQEGRIEVRDEQVIRTFTSNDCNTAYVGETVYDEVVSLQVDAMVVRTDSGYEVTYHRP